MRPIGLWSQRTGAPEASATRRDRTPRSVLGPWRTGTIGARAVTNGHQGSRRTAGRPGSSSRPAASSFWRLRSPTTREPSPPWFGPGGLDLLSRCGVGPSWPPSCCVPGPIPGRCRKRRCLRHARRRRSHPGILRTDRSGSPQPFRRPPPQPGPPPGSCSPGCAITQPPAPMPNGDGLRARSTARSDVAWSATSPASSTGSSKPNPALTQHRSVRRASKARTEWPSDLRFSGAPGRTRTCNLLFRRWLSLDAVQDREKPRVIDDRRAEVICCRRIFESRHVIKRERPQPLPSMSTAALLQDRVAQESNNLSPRQANGVMMS